MIAIDAQGAGEPLALLHGVGANRGIWRRVTPALAAERLVLAADLPGFGDSPAVGPGFELERVADAVADALADRAGGRFDLVGNSLGGAVALVLARRRPEAVSRLVLGAPAGFSPRPNVISSVAGRLSGPAVAARRAFGSPLADVGIARRALLWGAVARPERMSGTDARAMLQASSRSTRVGAAVTAVLRADLRTQLEQVHAPLGLIWGERDGIVPIAALRTIRALRPDAVVETIADAAHVPQLERPDEFVAALGRILARL
jgi:pimeloyl-ACP methyl ester carboxylesterase